MKSIVIYDYDTGIIKRVVNCPDDNVNLQLDAGEAVVEGFADDSKQMVVDGQIVDKDAPGDAEKNAQALHKLRKMRNDMLKQCDWTILADAPLTTYKKGLWKTYRQTLRDLPETYEDITNINQVDFPEAPN